MQWSDSTGNTGILQEILRSLKEPATDTGHWSFAELLRRANIVQREICKDTECLKLVDTSNTSVAGTAEYNKPTGCQRIVRVAYGNTRLFGILTSELDMRAHQGGKPWQNLTGPCSRYIDKPGKIEIVPTPSETGTVISIEYIAPPDDLVNPTDIPFKALSHLYPYHDLIVAGVVYRCLLEDQKAFYAEWKSIYNVGKASMIATLKDMPDTMMDTIIVPSGRGRNVGPLPFAGGW